MRRTDNYASNQIRILLNELDNSSHTDKKKALSTFQTYVETYHPEVADENVDYLFTGCINGKLGTGLLFWSGAGSEKGGALKRICSHVVRLIRWLVTHESESERGNFYYTRFVQLQLNDLKMVNFPKHITSKKKKKRRQDEEDANEDIFVLLGILMNDHRTPQGKTNRLDVDDLLLFDETANYLYAEWVNSGAIEQIPNYRGDKHREDAVPRPTAWDEVVFKVVPLQEGEEDTNELEQEVEVIPPIPDPLGISSVDLRSIQSFYSSGRLMKSQTGQLGRRATNAVMPIAGATPTAARKTSFRGSMTFVPYKHEQGDSDDSEEESEDGEEMEGVTAPNNDTPHRANADDAFDGSTETKQQGGEDGRPGLARTLSVSLKEKRAVPSVVPSDKNFSTVLFLTLVHGSASFNQLKAGQDHLQQHLMLQSSRRENLVRLHFGLFVQCAEGLEFLKAYRKGVLKGNELRQRRGSNYRKSIVNGEDGSKGRRHSAHNGADGNGLITEKGLERLKRSQATLDAAKVEAQRTLAPILERMKQSRRIRSAEKVLKRMTTILEYPVRMRTALDRGDLSEVVSLYQRVQAIPTSSSSLRILHKIKETAGTVVADLKKQCFMALMAPNPNYNVLLRYGQIWYDLEGESSYYEILRQCMIRQVLHFIERIKELRDKFCADCADANDRGLEQNLLRRSPFLSVGSGAVNDRESVSALIRRYLEQSNTRKRQGNRGGLSGDFAESSLRGRTSSDGTGQWQEEDNDVDFQENQDEFEIDGENSDDDWFDEDQELEDEFLDGDIDNLDFLDDISSKNVAPNVSNGNSKGRKSLTFSDDVRGGGGGNGRDETDVEERPSRRNSRNDVNHSVLLCSLVRQSCLESLVDLLAKWFPCMFRLASTLASMITTAGGSSNTPAPLLKSTGKANSTGTGVPMTSGSSTGKSGSSGSNAGYTNLNRGAIAPTRILGAALKLYSDYVKQVISGVEKSFSILNLPSELNSAFGEVDTFISNAHYPVHSVTPLVITLSNAMKVENKTYDVVASTVLHNPLREPFHRDALQEVFELYNAMEFIIKREATAQSVSSYANTAAPSNFMSTRVPFGAGPTGGVKNHLNFLSPTSPYYESMNTLQALSKEGEMALAQKIMDRLLELSVQVYTYDPDQVLASTGSGTSSLGGAMGRAATAGSAYLDALHAGNNKLRRRGSVMDEEVVASPGVGTLNKKGMEKNVEDLGDLIMRCLRSVRMKVKREEWVALVVQEGVQRVFSSFVEALRRESMKVADGHTSNKSRDSILNGVSAAVGSNGHGRRSKSGMRSSIGNGLVLESLEEELKFGDVDHNRASLQLDLLRACIRLRCSCIPRIGVEMKSVFALPDDQIGPNSTTSPTDGAQNKLPFPEVSVPAQAHHQGSQNGGSGATTGILSRTKSSLMTKLFTATHDKDSDPPSATPAAPVSAVSDSPARIGSKEKKKLTLLNILLMYVKVANVDLFEQNIREVVAIEDQAATTYVNIKSKEIRTTIFAGFALLVHNESCNMWKAPPEISAGSSSRISVHLARVLLTLGSERKVLADILGDMRVLKGSMVSEEDDEENGRPVTTPNTSALPSQAPTPSAPNRNLFGSVEDSGSDSDDGEDNPKFSAKKAYCESLLYKDHLYKQLCVGVLQVYQDLIHRLRTNSFSDRSDAAREAAESRRQPTTRRFNRVRGDMFSKTLMSGSEDDSASDDGLLSSRSEDAGGLSKLPLSLGQAMEEYKYLKELLMPLLNHDLTITYTETSNAGFDKAKLLAQDNAIHRYVGRMFASAEQLTDAGKMFSVMISSTQE